MISRKAWVITCLTQSRRLIESGAGSGAPLAILPPRSSKDRVEGAMSAVLQLLQRSEPSALITALRGSDRVEWDDLGRSARLGHDPLIFAEHSTLKYRENTATGDVTELVSYACAPWTTRGEIRDRAATLGASDPLQAYKKAREELSQHTQPHHLS